MMSNGAPSADANIVDGGASRDGRIMTGGMTSGAATTIGAEASAIGTIGAMTGANTVRGSLSTAVAGRDRRCTERKDATHECAMIAPSLAAALTVIRSTLGS